MKWNNRILLIGTYLLAFDGKAQLQTDRLGELYHCMGELEASGCSTVSKLRTDLSSYTAPDCPYTHAGNELMMVPGANRELLVYARNDKKLYSVPMNRMDSRNASDRLKFIQENRDFLMNYYIPNRPGAGFDEITDTQYYDQLLKEAAEAAAAESTDGAYRNVLFTLESNPTNDPRRPNERERVNIAASFRTLGTPTLSDVSFSSGGNNYVMGTHSSSEDSHSFASDNSSYGIVSEFGVTMGGTSEFINALNSLRDRYDPEKNGNLIQAVPRTLDDAAVNHFATFFAQVHLENYLKNMRSVKSYFDIAAEDLAKYKNMTNEIELKETCRNNTEDNRIKSFCNDVSYARSFCLQAVTSMWRARGVEFTEAGSLQAKNYTATVDYSKLRPYFDEHFNSCNTKLSSLFANHTELKNKLAAVASELDLLANPNAGRVLATRPATRGGGGTQQ